MRVFSLRRPSIDIAGLESAHVSHKGALSATGTAALESPAPPGFNCDTASVVVGNGDGAFAAARAALTGWQPFSMPWISLSPAPPRLELGRVAAVTVRTAGLLSVTSASRITLLIDQVTEDAHRCGFVHATLTAHAMRGEEMFLVTHDFATGDVTYSLVAHSRPGRLLSWVGYPAIRWYQRRFRSQSCEAMLREVSPEG